MSQPSASLRRALAAPLIAAVVGLWPGPARFDDTGLADAGPRNAARSGPSRRGETAAPGSPAPSRPDPALPAPGVPVAWQRTGEPLPVGSGNGASPPIPFDLSPADATLEAALHGAVRDLGLSALAADGRLGVALVDLHEPGHVRAAFVNGDTMFYAASLPKIAILLGAFDAVDQGRLAATSGLRSQLTRMIRMSDNAAASAVLRRVGFENVAATLQDGRYRLYEPALGGGLWVGKAYAQDRYWRRDPLASLSHAATPRQTARFFVLLEQRRLVSPEASAEMLAMLGNPGLRHKFVRGLAARPGATIYRKSGTWRQFHADAALVVRPDSRYVAVGLVESPRGEAILRSLIVALDDLVRRPA